MPVKIMIDANRTGARVLGVFRQVVIPQIAEEILADCNEFCKEDQDTLIKSSQGRTEDLKQGRLVWETPYAKKQYWEIRTAHKQKNPQASWRWAEKAKKRHKKRWADLGEKGLKENL